PPSNKALLDALAAEFRKQKYDLKQLIRVICASHVYSLRSLPNDRNASDTRNYSRHYRRRLRGETLLDGICEITGSPEKFKAMPPRSASTTVWTRRVESLFLDAFGRPDPNQDPPCERTPDSTAVQALHLMNAPSLHAKITADDGRAAKLAASKKTGREIVEELYLLAYARFPTDDEHATALRFFLDGKISRREATEDLMWALVNTPEFIIQN
ncbi:MAG: DUF1553 domain-containing protein, partial [Planctomycetales bacterium]